MSKNVNSYIPFSKPSVGLKSDESKTTGNELHYLQEVLTAGKMMGDGPFTKKCHQWLEQTLPANKALLTHSCTAALEMSAILADLGPGDEVIMPSFTFVSTANAVVLRGATPVFVDVREDTLNMDEALIEGALTPKTRAIFAVHYAGVGCEMDRLMEIANAKKLCVLEDAAQGLMARYKGKALGTIGHLGSLSFHETKNIVSGEGGALLINQTQFDERSEIIREKGTNRRQFLRGQIDKYTWVDIGSSYLPSELNAAVLLAQFERAEKITSSRLQIWNLYHEAFASLEAQEKARRPFIPEHCQHNGHIFYLLCRNLDERTKLLAHLAEAGVGSTFHYIPLHSAPAGRKYGRTHGSLSKTDSCSERIVRLPVWADMKSEHATRVIEVVHDFFNRNK
jgi:dTDP-4-amino-4,6-dideoxygalactose transaminase